MTLSCYKLNTTYCTCLSCCTCCFCTCCMSKSCNFITCVCVATSTCVCCVTCFCTCGSCYYCTVVMTKSCNFFCCSCTTNCTCKSLFTNFYTCRSFCYNTFIICMTKSCYFITIVCVSTSTCVRSISYLSTCGSYRCSCSIFMSVNFFTIKKNIAISRCFNYILHFTIKVCAVFNCYYCTINSVDTILVIICCVNISNVKCTILNCSIEICSNQAIRTVALNCTTVKCYAFRRTGHCRPTDNCTILIKNCCTLYDTVKVKCIYACSFECYVFEYEFTLSICPSLCITALDVNILKSKVFKCTCKCAFEENGANTFNCNACLHCGHSVCTCKYIYCITCNCY